MKKKIIAFGDIIWDVYPDKEVIGGAALNFISHASLLGAKGALISAVGDDTLGKGAIDALSSFGVDCKYIKIADAATGRCLVTLNDRGIPSFNVLSNTAYDNIILDSEDLSTINSDKFDALYFGTLIQRGEVSRASVRRLVKECEFSEIMCDVNLRKDCYDKDSITFCLESASLLKVSIEEEPLMRALVGYTPSSESAGDIARALCERYKNLRVVIITLGAEGSFAYDAGTGTEYTQKAIGDKVVSTVGAGDSFSAAFLTSYLDKKPIEECMRRGAELSGFVVAHTDAVPRY